MAAPKKNSQKSGKGKKAEAALPSGVSGMAPQAKSLLSTISYDQWAILGLLGAALVMFSQNHSAVWIRIVLAVGFLFQIIRIVRRRSVPVPSEPVVTYSRSKTVSPPPPPPKKEGSNRQPLLLAGFLALFALVLFTLPAFSWMFPPAKAFALPGVQWILVALWVGMIVAFKRSPEPTSSPDFSPGKTRLLLFIILGVGAYLRLFHGDSPMGSYADTQAQEILDERRVSDFKDYYDAFVFPVGVREPFFPYFSIFLWKLFPGMSSLMNQRLAPVLLDLGTLLVLYLIGKEAANRRVGLWAAALGAVSKPLIMRSLEGMSIMSLSLGVAVALLFFIRLLQRPTLSRFLQWGLALSFGIYTYTPYRPFVPFFIFAALAWTWTAQKKGGALEENVKLLLGATGFLFLVYFFYDNNAFPYGNWLAWLKDLNNYWLPALVLALYFILGIRLLSKTKPPEAEAPWMGWLAGSWICLVLTYPIMTNETIVNQIRGVRLGENGFLEWTYLHNALAQVGGALQLLFTGGNDRVDMFIPNDAFFGYSEILLLALGAASVLAKPSWIKGILFSAGVVGFSPYILTGGPHSGRLLGSVVPVLALGGIGLEEFLGVVSPFLKGKTWAKGVLVLLAGFWIWTAWTDVQRIYDQWFSKYLNKYTLVAQDARQEARKGERIYLARSMNDLISSVLYEGHAVYGLNSSSVIFRGPQDPEAEVLVYFDPGDTGTKDRIQKDYPRAQFSFLHSPDPALAESPLAVKSSISFADIADSSEKYSQAQEVFLKTQKRRPSPPGVPQQPPGPPPPLFEIRPIAPPYWIRQFFPGRFGLGLGLIDWEDKTVNTQDTVVPAVSQDREAVQMEGILHFDKGGKYELTLKAGGRTKVWVDGRKAFDVSFPRSNGYPDGYFTDPEKTIQKRLRLEAGDHHFKVLTCFERNRNLPALTIHLEGTPEEGKSLWSSFNF
jgi:hypothetical protein